LKYDARKRKQTKIVSASATANQKTRFQNMVANGSLQADLSNVPAHVPVYVIAHGNQGLDYIADQSMTHKMDANKLAENMSTLKKSHKVIKLFLCNVGLDLLRGQQEFGYEFWKTMHAKEYDALWVACYLGITVNAGSPFGGGKQVIDEDAWHRASRKRIFIAPDGTIYKPSDNLPDLL
jgi:hypothetical protein